MRREGQSGDVAPQIRCDCLHMCRRDLELNERTAVEGRSVTETFVRVAHEERLSAASVATICL